MEVQGNDNMGFSCSKMIQTSSSPSSSPTYCYDFPDTPMEDSNGRTQFIDDAESDLTQTTMPHLYFHLADLPGEMREAIFRHALNGNTIPVDLDKHRDMLKEGVAQLAATSRDNTAIPSSSNTNPNPSNLNSNPNNPNPSVPNATNTPGQPVPDPPLVYVCIRNSPLTNPLLANKQWNKEYGAVAHKAKQLVFTDHQQYHFTNFELPSHVKDITNLEFNLLLLCQQLPCSTHVSALRCHACHELRTHFHWIGHVMSQMPKIKRINFYAHISHADFKLDSKTKPPCEPFVLQMIREVCRVKRLKHIAVYRYDSKQGERSLDGAKEKIFEWVNGVEKEVKGKDDKKTDGKKEEKGEKDGSEEESASEGVEVQSSMALTSETTAAHGNS